MNRTLGILTLALATAGGGAAFACDHDCSGKTADCAARHADCAAQAPTAEKASAAEGHACAKKAEQCAENMRKDAETHGWLGVGLNMSAEGRMSVEKVWADSPAEKAGVQVGDQILALNGVPVDEPNIEKIFSLMKDAKIGDQVSLDVTRGSQRLSLSATLGRMPEEVLAESIQKHLQEHHQTAKN